MYTIELNRRTLANWERMENENAHGERLRAIADYFYKATEKAHGPWWGFYEIRCVLCEINRTHEAAGHLTPFLGDLRRVCLERLRGCILEVYGADVLRAVNP